MGDDDDLEERIKSNELFMMSKKLNYLFRPSPPIF